MSLLSRIGREVFDVSTGAASVRVSVLGNPLEEATRSHITRVLTGLIEDSPEVARQIGRVRIVNEGPTQEISNFLDRAYEAPLGMGSKKATAYATRSRFDVVPKEKGALKGLSLKKKLSVVSQRLFTEQNRSTRRVFGNLHPDIARSPNPHLRSRKGSITLNLQTIKRAHNNEMFKKAVYGERRNPFAVGFNDSATWQDLAGHILTHEFGHHIDYAMFRPDKAIRTHPNQLLKYSNEELIPISEYGQTKYVEFFAETFAQMRKDPSVVPERLRKEFQKSKALKKLYNPRSMTPLYTDGPPGQRVVGRDPNFGASMAETVGDEAAKKFTIPNAGPFSKTPNMVRGQVALDQPSNAMMMEPSTLNTPDKQLMTSRRHSSARNGLPVRSSATGVFVR